MGRKPSVHFESDRLGNIRPALCGTLSRPLEVDDHLFTRDAAEVTCRNCLRYLDSWRREQNAKEGR